LVGLNENYLIKIMETALPQFFKIIREKIYFPRSRKWIPLQEIIMLQGEVNYTLIHLISGRKLLIPRTLKLFENILINHDFLRTHRGYIINCDHLQSIDNEGDTVNLSNNLQASISRRRKVEVSRILELQA
jgi:DNA-binding LytR/AlgR family response regulator